MFDTALVLLVVAGLLIVVGLSQPLAARLRLPQSVVLAAIGMAIGVLPVVTTQLGFSHSVDVAAGLFADLPINSVTFIYVFLPLLVFEAGIATDVRRTIEDAAAILLLAVVATLITAGVIGLSLWPFAGFSLVVCMLLGSIVATTDPAAVIAVFRDVGAPRRLTWLVAGEALLNDAAAIALFILLLGIIQAGREPSAIAGLSEFTLLFVGGGMLGYVAGRSLLWIMHRVSGDRLAEATLTLAFAYLSFIVAERFIRVSGVVAVLAAGLTVSALAPARIAPQNWSFLSELWEQMAFWGRSLIFVLASILVPRLLLDIGWRDVFLLAILIAAAFGARILALFVLLPPLERLGFVQRINASYKMAITWGGLRGALTLVLALAVTENSALPRETQRFVAVLATGLVLFTLFVNGTTLRLVIHLLGLDRLSPRDEALRDHVLELSYVEARDAAQAIARTYALSKMAVTQVIAPYETKIETAKADEEATRNLNEKDRLAIALVALGNRERVLIIEMLRDGVVSPAAAHVLLGNADELADAARNIGRSGYERAADAALAHPLGFRVAYFLYRHLQVVRPLADRLAERLEMLLVMRFAIERLVQFNQQQISRLFGEPIAAVTGDIVARRQQEIESALDALRRQYPDYLAELEVRFLRQSMLHHEMGRYQSLFEEGLISHEIYDDLKRTTQGTTSAAGRLHFDIGLDTHQLVRRLDLLASLDERQLEAVCRLLRPRFAVPHEQIIRKGERGDAVYFIASGAVEVILPDRRVRIGSGEFFGEMALLSGRPRQADVVALSYCRFLVLRRTDFEKFMNDNPQSRDTIVKIAEARRMTNIGDRKASAITDAI